MDVNWTIPAKEDLHHIYSYISQDSVYYALEVSEAILEATSRLSGFPFQGRVVPELSDDGVRELFLYSYRVIYQLKNDSIYILAIVNMRQILGKGFLL